MAAGGPCRPAEMVGTCEARRKGEEIRKSEVPTERSPSEADFIALSSVCPHLGCRVHWQSQESRFFCPCHNGSFDPQGKPTGGPPLAAGQSLPKYPLKVEHGLLFIEMPIHSVGGRKPRGMDVAGCRRAATVAADSPHNNRQEA